MEAHGGDGGAFAVSRGFRIWTISIHEMNHDIRGNELIRGLLTCIIFASCRLQRCMLGWGTYQLPNPPETEPEPQLRYIRPIFNTQLYQSTHTHSHQHAHIPVLHNAWIPSSRAMKKDDRLSKEKFDRKVRHPTASFSTKSIIMNLIIAFFLYLLRRTIGLYYKVTPDTACDCAFWRLIWIPFVFRSWWQKCDYKV